MNEIVPVDTVSIFHTNDMMVSNSIGYRLTDEVEGVLTHCSHIQARLLQAQSELTILNMEAKCIEEDRIKPVTSMWESG